MGGVNVLKLNIKNVDLMVAHQAHNKLFIFHPVWNMKFCTKSCANPFNIQCQDTSTLEQTGGSMPRALQLPWLHIRQLNRKKWGFKML